MDAQSQARSRHHSSLKACNPKTTARFKRQAWWQITFPVLAVAVLLLGGLGALFFLVGTPGVSVTADYSIILLSIPMLVLGLVILVIIAASTYLVMLLIRLIPPYTFVAHGYFQKTRDVIVGFMGKITGALIGLLSLISGISLFLKQYTNVADSRQESSSGPIEPGAGLD
ncbi:MAG: hypothetical protein JXB07_09530 [Anaerolineae bacterium]|nr:hypothetical protein [Anaerolineae bacterium]